MTRNNRNYSLCLNSAGIAMGARQLGFEVEGLVIDKTGNAHVNFGNKVPSRYLCSLLNNREPIGFRGYLNSISILERRRFFSDALTVVLAGREAVAMGDPMNYTTKQEFILSAQDRMRTCFNSFGPFLGDWSGCVGDGLVQRAARVVGGCWADVVLLAVALFQYGRVSEKLLRAPSILTGEPLKFDSSRG